MTLPGRSVTYEVDELESFFARLDSEISLSNTEMIDYFVYFLTVVKKSSGARPVELEECFALSHLHPPGVSQYLSTRSRGRNPKLLRDKLGYRLSRARKEEIEAKANLNFGPVVQVSQSLRELLTRLPEGSEREFLREVIACYEVGAYRATVVMGWILTIDHLYELVLARHLTAFNAELAKVTDRRVKVGIVARKDDFSDIPEDVFIRLLRSSGIISNEVRKILETKLGIRNSSAHPSGVSVSQSKATDFLEDLTLNVMQKHPL